MLVKLINVMVLLILKWVVFSMGKGDIVDIMIWKWLFIVVILVVNKFRFRNFKK